MSMWGVFGVAAKSVLYFSFMLVFISWCWIQATTHPGLDVGHQNGMVAHTLVHRCNRIEHVYPFV